VDKREQPERFRSCNSTAKLKRLQFMARETKQRKDLVTPRKGHSRSELSVHLEKYPCGLPVYFRPSVIFRPPSLVQMLLSGPFKGR
jgi:hypothetical protein